jgi:hypothetical protein
MVTNVSEKPAGSTFYHEDKTAGYVEILAISIASMQRRNIEDDTSNIRYRQNLVYNIYWIPSFQNS